MSMLPCGMRSIQAMAAAAFVILWPPLVIRAQAQQYRPGSSYKEAQAVAAAGGHDLMKVGEGFIERRQNADGSFSFGRGLSFCSNVLSGVSNNIKGGLSAFAQTAKSLEQKHGTGASSIISEYNQFGLTSMIDIRFYSKDGSVHRVSISEVDGSAPNVTYSTDFSSTVCK